jgi:hypothetical protein
MSSSAVSCPHLLPRGFVRIRHFGFLANRRRATLLPLCFSITRPRTTTPDRTSSIRRRATQPSWSLSQNAAGPWSSSRPSPPLRSCSVLRLRTSVPHETNFQKPQIPIRPSDRSALVRLAPEKVLVPDPESVPTAVIFYFNHPLPAHCSSPTKHTGPSPTSCRPSTPLKTHSHRRPTAPRGGFLQVVVSKATAADSDEATNFSSAVASDTTLGLLARVVESLFGA